VNTSTIAGAARRLLAGVLLLWPACAEPAVQSSPWLYLVDAGGGTSRILRLQPDGSGLETVLDPAPPASRGIVLDGAARTLYWASRDGDRLQRAQLSDSARLVPQDVLVGLDSAYALSLDAGRGHLYWSDYGTGANHRASLDGSDARVVVSGLQSPRGLDLDTTGGWVYWTDVATSKVQRARFDGSDMQDLLDAGDGLARPYGVTLDAAAGVLYIADAGTGHILRARTDGSAVEVLLAESGPHPSFILIVPEEGRFYWTDNRANRVRRARLDGTQVEDILATGLAGPRGLVRVQ
jgi:sugar lactone lactonase YvrE